MQLYLVKSKKLPVIHDKAHRAVGCEKVKDGQRLMKK
jgi:hypothetical protein